MRLCLLCFLLLLLVGAQAQEAVSQGWHKGEVGRAGYPHQDFTGNARLFFGDRQEAGGNAGG